MPDDGQPNRFQRGLRSVGAFSATALGRVVRAILYGLCGAVVVLALVFVAYLQGRPDLEVWHRVHLDEFTADSDVDTFEAYQAREKTLFAELDREVYDRIEAEDRTNINRYHRDSLADPARWPQNWNRSFEMPSRSANVGVLLLHGMSDSPYSLRELAEQLEKRDVWVVCPRLPGHGTAPAGLTDIRWEDLEKVTRMSALHLRSKVSGPIYVIGYSTGGPLAIQYALKSLVDENLPRIDGIVLISPAMGVSKVAAFAVWQGRVGRWLGLDKLAWNDLSPEYDPFKYQSFAVNAGDVVYRLDAEVQKQFDVMPTERLKQMPPLLAFQSSVDATVVPAAVVDGLFMRLPDNGNELVLFDINRSADVQHVLAQDPASLIDPLLAGGPRPFKVDVLTNRDDASREVVLRVRQAGGSEIEIVETGMSWPSDIYSVSHVALPTPYDDPLYGGDPNAKSPGIQLGRLAFRGERGVLRVSPAAMLRLQWNPFYPWMQERILEFIGVPGGPVVSAGGTHDNSPARSAGMTVTTASESRRDD